MLRFISFFTLKRQAILFVVSTILAFTLQFTWGFAWSWIFFLIMILLLTKYFLLGTVNAAAMAMQMGNLDEAQRLLSYTKKPEWLRFGYHPSYYLIKGQILFQKGEDAKTEQLCYKALKLEMPDDLKATFYLLLVNITGKKQQAMGTTMGGAQQTQMRKKLGDYLKELKKLNVTEGMIKEQIKQLDLAMQGKHPDQAKMMRKQQQRGAANFMTKRGGRK